ncbi:Microtubule-nucleating Tub4p (gamma-tubulin) complex component [Conoideocrella luteorostrata]|uniref:Microtubule-nucleating Tub4p (Gamma-tubulin) complex component n=1 Tax=Conoideocrella luteorostrata TaxID=1105319 RepID=A0AAJ0CKG5_9HYPO|nr:Microtubule-nucleating Tub4p (gamma-tubulin) complex component [Conoideocrella luteorostrata]
MASERIISALEHLIIHIVPTDPDEDSDIAQERHDACLELATSIIDNPQSPSISSDVNHASDLIKRKLIQTNPTQALKFSNLYSRLLSLPVLEHKWAILYLLYQLADSPDPNEPLPFSPVKPSAPNYREAINRDALKRQIRDQSKPSTPVLGHEEEQFRDAFQPEGLRKVSGPKPGTLEREQQPKRDVSLKSTLLASNNTEFEPPETDILRDLPFTLQGLSSTTLPFSKPDTLNLPPTVPLPIVSILHTLAEPSLLYRGLDEFCKTPANGLLGQSLRSAIGGELRSYLSLIATLETQIRQALSSLDRNAPRGGIGKAGVTLKRCVVWTREATMGLRLMSLIAEESENKIGGRLISLIHSFSSSHGDPVVAAFAERLLGSFTRPFYDILRHWIYDGELSDPYHEFFVREQHAKNIDVSKLKGAGNVWTDKYEIDQDMIPSTITQDFAQKVFLIGKSLNFIRHSCGDSLWVEDYSKAASKELRYGDTATLEAWIDEAYKTTMKRLMDLMSTKFHLFEHLKALKDYILLGQGDFIALLMESLAANLDRPAGVQYRHTLTAQLEHAIRGSNAQYDSPEVLRRLDARMLQLSHGDIGWDCFTLEYKIDAPVDVVVTEWGNRQYLKVFNFLWRIKRVEFALLSTWRKCMTGSRGVLQNSDQTVTQTWKSTRGVLAEMIHFVGQLQYYILFEVIESSWDELQRRIHKEDCTLDDLINAHERYLNDITHKGLLGAKRRHHGAEDDDRASSYLGQLSDILRFMLSYRDSVDGLYSWSVSDFTRRQEADVRTSTKHDLDDHYIGAGGVSSEFPVLQDRLHHLGTTFKGRVQILLGDLAYQPNVDMRFLGVAMNFNDVYQPARRKTRPATQAASANTSKA